MSVPGAPAAVVHCLDERRTAAFSAGLGARVLVESSDDAVTYAGPRGRLSFVRVARTSPAAYPLDDGGRPRRLGRSRRPGVGLGRRTARGRRRPEGDVVGPLEPAQDRS